MGVTQISQWFGVVVPTDDMASAPASVDLACMLVAFTRPKVLVEAGTYRGHLAFALANILRQVAPDSHLWTADTDGAGMQELLDSSNSDHLRPFLTFHAGDFLEMLKDVPDPIDFAYIDASAPDQPHMRWDHAHAVYARLSPGGLILVDDTQSPDWPDAVRFREWGGIHLPQLRGLTIIQKELA